MANPQFGNVPSLFNDTKSASFIAASGTLAKVLFDVAPASGNLTGGQRVFDITAVSTDSVANMALIWEGFQASLYANMGAVTTGNTTNATYTRTTGSFITDGFTVGDSVMSLGSVNAGNNGLVGTITAVTALGLTLNGVPTGFSAGTEGAGFRLIKVTHKAPVAIAANAGNATSSTVATSNVTLLAAAYDVTKDTSGIELGPNSLLLVSMYQATSALPVVIQVTGRSALR